jgi:hypothetical protein
MMEQSGLMSYYIIKTMGPSNSQSTRKINHFFFGEATKKRSLNKEVLYVERLIMNREDFDDWKDKYDLVNEMNKESLFVPEGFDYHTIQRPFFDCCGAEGKYEVPTDPCR